MKPYEARERDDQDFEMLSSFLFLDEDTGQLLWRLNHAMNYPGQEAGHCDKMGYRRICLYYKMYLAHRIVFLLTHGHWPLQVCDHIDRNPRNNRPSNLRDVSVGDNGINSKLRIDNKTGGKGLFLNKWGAWEVHKRGKYLGTFKDKTIAMKKYEESP